jgi:hypothetical protein
MTHVIIARIFKFDDHICRCHWQQDMNRIHFRHWCRIFCKINTFDLCKPLCTKSCLAAFSDAFTYARVRWCTYIFGISRKAMNVRRTIIILNSQIVKNTSFVDMSVRVIIQHTSRACVDGIRYSLSYRYLVSIWWPQIFLLDILKSSYFDIFIGSSS